MRLRILLFVVIVLFSLLGYITYLNHETSTTLFLIQGKPLTTSLPAVIIVSFAAGALIVFVAGLIRDLFEGLKEFRRERRARRREALHVEIAKGLDFLTRGEVEKSRIHLTSALKRDPKNQDIYGRLSDIHASQGDLKEAVKVLERALAINSRNVEILLKKARLHDNLGNMAMAIEALERALIVSPNNQTALTELRDLYLRQKNWKEALSYQEKIMKILRSEMEDSEENSLYLGLKYEYARSLARDGNEESLDRALRLSKEIIKQEKRFQPAYILMGEIYQNQKQWAEAGRILGKGFRVSRSVIFLRHLEDLYLKRDDPKTLLKIYRRTLESNPENLVIPFFYSQLCLKLNMLDEAMDELVEVQRRGKEIPAIHGLIAEVFVQKGQPEEAVREYKKIVELTDSLRLAFFCESCGRESTDWSARCPACKRWNTYFQEGEEASSRDMEA